MSRAEHIDFLSFDCYGTLVDWESGIIEALRPVLGSHGVEVEDAHVLSTYAELEARAEKGLYRPYREVLVEVVRGFGRRYGFRPAPRDETCLVDSIGTWRPFGDTVPALRALSRRFGLVVISNVDDELFAGTRALLEVDLHRVITAEQARAYKPDRRVFEHALLELGCPASRLMHVAQSMYHDVNPAHAMGFRTVWVERGRRGRKGATLPAAGQADLVVRDLATLAQIIL